MDDAGSPPMTALAKWLAKQPRGAMSRLRDATGLSFPTIDRAKRGKPVSQTTARLISQATGRKVAIRDIEQVKVGRERIADESEDVVVRVA
jgi:hypothetical protein